MDYQQQISKAPATNGELLKAALLEVVGDICRRLDQLEKPPTGLPLLEKTDFPTLIQLLKEEIIKELKTDAT
jgi:hypothetical protein